jgi:hypothetical protein
MTGAFLLVRVELSRYWHKADNLTAPTFVRLPHRKMSAYDPKRTYSFSRLDPV